MFRACGSALALWFALNAPAGEIILENQRLRLVLGEDAAWRAVVDTATGKEYCAQGKRIALASVRAQDRSCQANRAELEGGRLTIGFEGCDTRLTYAVKAERDWVLFRLDRCEGTRPGQVTLAQLGVTITEHVGPRLGGAWNEEFAICLMAANLQTQCGARRRENFAELTATTQDAPGPKLEGAAVALVACPTKELDAILQKLAVAYDLPRNDARGAPSRNLPIARQSYWFLSFGEKDVEKVIDCCKRAGIRQVMMGSGSWCRTVGHYTFNANYPEGVESLRRTVAKLHDNGILVGMHCFASKISKTDAYVTPVPDRRFWVDMSAPLAADIGPNDDAIRASSGLSQWPGSPASRQKIWEGGVAKHQEVIVDDEIIRYNAIGPEGRFDTFLGCERGAWGTRKAEHKAGTAGRHYGVDGCINGYIVDQETTLLDETTSRLADIFNRCGFDMVYFDGGEDVDRRRFTYYVSKFQAVAIGKFTKRPLIHMGTIMTHDLIHSFTRSGTVDTYLNTLHGHIIAGGKVEKWPTVKDHIDRSVAYMLSVREDRIPGEVGWFGIWPKGKETDGLQLDEIEYLMCKSLAYDAPVSLQTGFSQMESHPLTPGILEIVCAYEELRLSNWRNPPAFARLREKGKDFVLLSPGGSSRMSGADFVEVEPFGKVAGSPDIRAFIGARGSGALVTLWHVTGKQGKLRLKLPDPKSQVARVVGNDILGNAIELAAYDHLGRKTTANAEVRAIEVPIGERRTTLMFAGLAPDVVRGVLAEAKLEPQEPISIWLQAEDAVRIVGKMAKGSDAGVKEPDAFGDVVLCTDRPDREKPQEWYCEYRVEIPHEGRWTLWARVRYPSGSDDSFGIVPAGEKVTLAGNQVLGNCGVTEKKWHWTGRGSGTAAAPPGEPITFTLPKGPFTFRIYAREGAGTLALNPRLDCLCLTDEANYVPTGANPAKRD